MAGDFRFSVSIDGRRGGNQMVLHSVRQYAAGGLAVSIALIATWTLAPTASGAATANCPSFSAPPTVPEHTVAFGTSYDPLAIDFGTSRAPDTSQTILSAQPPHGQQLPRGQVEVAINALRRSTHGSLQRVTAAAQTQGQNRVSVTLCVDPTTSDIGTYTGSVVITDPRFDTASIPVTIRLQQTWTGWTWPFPFLLSLVAVAIAVASVEAKGPTDGFKKRFVPRLLGVQSFLALLTTLGAAYAVWASQIVRNPTWGSDGVLSLGAFWLVGASAVTAATAVLATAATAGSQTVAPVGPQGGAPVGPQSDGPVGSEISSASHQP